MDNEEINILLLYFHSFTTLKILMMEQRKLLTGRPF